MSDKPADPSNLPAKTEVLNASSPPSTGPGRTTQIVARSMEFSGPLPHPDILAGYERVHKGCADRLIKMAEQEAEHRRLQEALIVQAGIEADRARAAEAKRGQLCALTIAIAALFIGAWTANAGHDVAAGFLGVSGVGGIVTTFIIGRSHPKPKPEDPPAGDRQSNKKKRKGNSTG